jgi:predicted enzyme related to lactoylglutathione lyase
MGRSIGYFDIASPNASRLQKFYKELFDWQMTPGKPEPYAMVTTNPDEGVPGGIGASSDTVPAGVVLYVVVDNVKKELERVQQLGGNVDTPPFDIPGYGTLAVFKDPDGNRFGLWQK